MLRELDGILKRTQSIVFSSDGQSIVSGGSYGTTNIWDVHTGRLQLTLFAFSSTSDGPASDNWLAYGQGGTFIGSKSIDRYVAWRHGDDFETAAEKKSE
jgi:WD40 repeat protein